MINDAVKGAIDELVAQFGESNVSFEADGSGGAFVRIDVIDLPSPPYNTPTWLGMHIVYTYPAAEIYPVFVRQDLRADGAVKKPPFSDSTFRQTPATAISRKPKYGSTGSAVAKALKIIAFLESLAA